MKGLFVGAVLVGALLVGCAKDPVVSTMTDAGADAGGDAGAGDMGGDASTNMFSFSEGFSSRTYTGGTTATETASTCEGFFSATPVAYAILPTALTRFRIRVESEGANETLRVVFGASSFCGVADGDNGVVVERGSWSAGTYEIYVGSDTDNQSMNFELTFEEPL